MNKKTAAIALVILIAAAIFIAIIFLNKGDGPIAGVFISDKAAADVSGYKSMNSARGNGFYLVWNKEFNSFKEKVESNIPAGKDLYANVHFVECMKGTRFTAKWIANGETVKEETSELLTNQQGIIAYLLEGNQASIGSYSLEIWKGDKKLFTRGFSIE